MFLRLAPKVTPTVKLFLTLLGRAGSPSFLFLGLLESLSWVLVGNGVGI